MTQGTGDVLMFTELQDSLFISIDIQQPYYRIYYYARAFMYFSSELIFESLIGKQGQIIIDVV